LIRNFRKDNDIRNVKITRDFCPNSYGSVLLEMEKTRIICAVSVNNKVPDHASNKGTGWLTAEYSLLPYSTANRTARPILKKDGRSVEIQRLIARSIRGIIDLTKIQGINITIDCDVLQADGGTRTASITGAYIALKIAVQRLLTEGLISENPLYGNVAAISVGYVDSELLIDLDYSEDRIASVDMNVVMNDKYEMIEIQGTGESGTFSADQLNSMVKLAQKGIKELIDIQNNC